MNTDWVDNSRPAAVDMNWIVMYPNFGLFIYDFIVPKGNLTVREELKNTQLAIACSKLTIETLEQGVKYVVLVFLLLTLNIFHTKSIPTG